MMTKSTLLLGLSMLLSGVLFGQTQFWSDNFEDTGSPSSGVRTPSNNIGLGYPSTLYFKRTTSSQIDASFGSYTGQNGTSFWAGENHGGLFGAGNEEQNIVFSSIDISGKTGLTFKGLFAANNQGAAFENMALGASHSDYMIVEYNIDGGAYQPLLKFFANNNTTSGTNNKSLAEDTNSDGIGDGTILTANFTTFTKTIAGTGTTLILRVRCSSNGNNEEMAFDYFQLLADACVPPVVTANPPNRFICSGGNTTFGISATDATSYQWQVDSGSGFSNVSNGGVYSGATTTTLTVTGATVAMTGYTYRCVAINGSGDCSTNSNGATLSISNMITSGSKNDATCNGVANGAAAISVSGGATPYSYSWSPSGGTGNVATGLSAGSYTVTVTDNIGCTTTRSFTITEPTQLTAVADAQTNVSCNGENDGQVSVAVSGGTAPYTYDWTGTPNGDGTASVTGLSAGAISCTVTDANSCTASVNFTITEPTQLTAVVDAQTNVSCNGENDGQASVAVSGGTAPYTYDWTGTPNGDGTASVTGLSAGAISCTVTDANGCTASVNFTITEPTALTAVVDAQTNVSCNGENDGQASVAVSGGTAPYSYDWTETPNGDGTASVTGLSAGVISCTVTDANGCTASVNFTITEPTQLTAVADAQTNISCNGENDGQASVTVSGGTAPYTYDWTGTPNGDGTASVTGLSAGAISCTVTDANGCTASVNFTITEPTQLTAAADAQTNISCNGENDGQASVAVSGGTAPYTYDWTGTPNGEGTASATGLSAGAISCTVTDANGCTASVNFTITEPTQLTAAADAQTNISCNGENDGQASIAVSGGTAPYTYDWTGTPNRDGTASATGLSAGAISCTVTDANGCTASVNFTITEPTQLTAATDAQTNISCNGENDGQASVAVSGGTAPYTYDWTGTPNGDGTASATGLSAGAISCTVTDANGCTASVNFTITETAALKLVKRTQTNVSCHGTTDGSASVSVTGGAGGYQYDWSPGNPGGDGTRSVTGLGAGVWTCTVTDANNCTSSVQFVIKEPNPINFLITETACDSYTINGETYISSGIYTQTLQNAALCDSIITIDLTIHESYFESETVETCGSYTWSDGLTYTSSGTYQQELTAANGCDSIQELILTILENPATTISSSDGTTLSVEAGAKSYQWIDCATNEPIEGENSNIFVASDNGEYAVVVSNTNGCISTSECFVVTTVGINDPKIAEILVNLYPNPTSGTVTLSLTEVNETDVLVYNARGKLVLSLHQVKSGSKINLSSFGPGVYYIKGKHKRGVWTKQIVKI